MRINHGGCVGGKSFEYLAYIRAKKRCTNPKAHNYRYYGGRGIQFRFSSFVEWFAELGKRPSTDHTPDRIDSNGHYERGNVKWSTHSEQMLNRRPYCRKLKHRRDLTGKVFGRLIAQWPEGVRAHNTIWLCSCVCGGLSHVSAGNLKNGHTKSCGCEKGNRKCLSLK